MDTPLPGLGRSRQMFPARFIEVLDDPRDDQGQPWDGPLGDERERPRILHLQGRDGATILQVVDQFGRLHRTDGPAVIGINGSNLDTSWWAVGQSLDDAAGELTVIDTWLQGLGSSPLYGTYLRHLEGILPRGFKVTANGTVLAPSSVAGALDTLDIAELWERESEDEDPVVALARSVHVSHPLYAGHPSSVAASR
ncbi:hypothetical protein GCG21_08610 [Pseudactinotalea sp. HY160]|uniref:hypothetical protein n=1 Tax=Pseudactinotalea sp. HY160 TaxID=2654490 RepID=UPI00128CA3F5|nr:hypothetical protein [Pseudactinotalea sp. HY160]MPV50065.1 hypothetical protein [Pseudactinotalea sp. HY160]